MLSLIRYLKDYKKEAILAPLFKLLEASFELIVPLVMAAMIDRGIHTADKGFVLQMGGILLLTGSSQDKVKAEMAQVLDLETRIARASKPVTSLRDPRGDPGGDALHERLRPRGRDDHRRPRRRPVDDRDPLPFRTDGRR